MLARDLYKLCTRRPSFSANNEEAESASSWLEASHGRMSILFEIYRSWFLNLVLIDFNQLGASDGLVYIDSTKTAPSDIWTTIDPVRNTGNKAIPQIRRMESMYSCCRLRKQPKKINLLSCFTDKCISPVFFSSAPTHLLTVPALFKQRTTNQIILACSLLLTAPFLLRPVIHFPSHIPLISLVSFP